MNRPRAVDFLDPKDKEENSFESEKEFLDEAPIVVSESENEKIEDSEFEGGTEGENEFKNDSLSTATVLPSGAISKGTIKIINTLN